MIRWRLLLPSGLRKGIIAPISLLMCCAGLAAGAERPSKRAESESLRTAHAEVERATGLSNEGIYRVFNCEVFFYSSLADQNNFGGLKDVEKAELQRHVGTGSFFLHRFTPKDRKKQALEVYVSEDGAKILWKRQRPKKVVQRIGSADR